MKLFIVSTLDEQDPKADLIQYFVVEENREKAMHQVKSTKAIKGHKVDCNQGVAIKSGIAYQIYTPWCTNETTKL